MKRKKKPSRKRTRRKAQDSETIKDEKKKIKEVIKSLSSGDWNSDERETSILFDYGERVVFLETSYGPTARRWFKNLWGDPKVKWDAKASTLKLIVPWDYCRKPDLIIKSKYRQFNGK